jgi:cytoskeletal protein RodZ
MATFGENLRRERELRGITLGELAQATKIGQNHLQALESAQFENLPGGVISRGFVRSISRYMKIDEEHWVGEYILASQEEPELPTYNPARKKDTAVAARNRIIAAVVLLTVFGGAAYGIHRLQRNQEPDAAAAATAGAVTQSPAPLPDSSETPATTAQPPATSPAQPVALPEPETALPASNAADSASILRVSASELRLQIDILQDAWVELTVDDIPAYEGTLTAGDSRTFTGTQTIELTTRNASAVVLTLNGDTLAPLGFPGETKKITLTTRSTKATTPVQ